MITKILVSSLTTVDASLPVQQLIGSGSVMINLTTCMMEEKIRRMNSYEDKLIVDKLYFASSL